MKSNNDLPMTPGRFAVYHLLPQFARQAYTRSDFPLSAFTLVATVDAPCLAAVFELTNHIDSNWTENAEVVALFVPKDRVRSTSVGDVVSDELGDFYRVDGCGWSKLVCDYDTGHVDGELVPARSDDGDVDDRADRDAYYDQFRKR